MESDITDLQTRLAAIEDSLDLNTLTSRKGELETRSMEPGFWENQTKAQKIMKEISIIEETLDSFEEISKAINNIAEYRDLLKESDEEPGADFEKEVEDAQEMLDQFELRQFLSGPYDKEDALLSIHAGQGGTEANDWAEMLMRMYLRYAESKEWKTDVVHMIIQRAPRSVVPFATHGGGPFPAGPQKQPQQAQTVERGKKQNRRKITPHGWAKPPHLLVPTALGNDKPFSVEGLPDNDLQRNDDTRRQTAGQQTNDCLNELYRQRATRGRHGQRGGAGH